MDIQVRMARPGDSRWLKNLVAESALYSIAEARDIAADLVRRQAVEDLEELQREGACVVLVAYEAASQERVGFLVLATDTVCALTGQPTTVVDSLGVEPRFWGSPAVGRLVRRAARYSFEQGVRFMSGFITAGNHRTLLKALRLGFEMEQVHLAVACGPEGVEPMPGRQDSERAHHTSRQERLLRRRRKGEEGS